MPVPVELVDVVPSLNVSNSFLNRKDKTSTIRLRYVRPKALGWEHYKWFELVRESGTSVLSSKFIGFGLSQLPYVKDEDIQALGVPSRERLLAILKAHSKELLRAEQKQKEQEQNLRKPL